MNNLISTEKALKHWLKNKVAVTTATVVGFLIMGTVSFGAQENLKLTESDFIGLFGSKTYLNTNNITATNGTSAIRIENITSTDAIFENEGATISSNREGDSTGILIQGSVDEITINNNNGANTIGTIEVQSSGNNQSGAYGINSAAKNTTIKNNGVIKVNHELGGAYAISLANSFDVTNNGNISAVSEKGVAYGITTYSTDSSYSGKIINNKEISTESKNGAASVPISVVVKDSNVEIENNGTLTSKRNGTPGNLGAIYLSNTGNGKVKFTNNNIIKTDNGITTELTGNNSEFINNGIIELTNGSTVVKNNENKGTATINGIIKITDKNIDELKDFNIESLFNGKVNNQSMITDKNGIAITQDSDINLAGDVYSSTINNIKEKKIVFKTNNTTLIHDGEQIIDKNLDFKTNVNSDGVTFNNGILNFDVNGKLNLLKDTTTKFEGTQVNKVGDNKDTLLLENNAELRLSNTNINGASISGEGEIFSKNKTSIKANIYANNLYVENGEMYLEGKINIKEIKVGQDSPTTSDKTAALKVSAKSSFGVNTSIWNSQTGVKGTTIFEIDKDGGNALKNSTAPVTLNGKIDFDTTNLTTNTTVKLNNSNVTHNLEHAKYDEKTGIYTTKLDRPNNTLEFSYNRSLFADARLNEINNAAQIVNDKFSNDISIREGQMDKIYSGSIYAETIRAAYDNLKLNEGTILSLSNNVKAGEFTAEGRAIYNKDEYKRDGIVGKYDVENETSGLLASLEYGVNDTTKTGLVFAGSKQDLDVTGGKADGDLFYLGFYGVKSLGNYDLTAGLGYQLGKYDATNTAANVVGKDKYDTKALSGYVQAKYLGDLGDGLSIQPKVKLGYTHLKQDSAKDSYFGLTDTDVTTFDTELGADLVKTVQLEKSKVDVKFGTAFVKTFGDTDKEFKGQFFGANTASSQFGVHGGELSENVLKFNLGAEVANENGFFYNGGFTYEFGSEDMKSYGVNVGAGYRF